MDTFKQSLANRMRANFPFICISTWEEKRAFDTIVRIARDRLLVGTERYVYEWSLLAASGDYERCAGDCSKDLLNYLNYIKDFQWPAVFVIYDIQAFFNSNKVDYEVIRRLKEAQLKLKRAKEPINIIFLSSTVTFPRELEKDISFIDFQLPAANEIGQLLERTIRANDERTGTETFLAAEDKDRLVQAALGLTLDEAENAFALAMVRDGLGNDGVDLILEEKKQMIKRSNLLEYIGGGLKLDEVGGLDNLKLWLSKRSNSWTEQAHAYGISAPKGVLLTGVPGCGKSLIAKAVSSLWKLPLLRLDVGKLFGMWIGTYESNMRSAIQMAEAIAPCVLWIDEIEKGFRGVGSSGDSGTASRVFGTFLTWMQEKTKMVFVIATANDISGLPPELMRKGRFDEIFFVDLPNREERAQILRLHLKKRLTDPYVSQHFKMTDEDIRTMADRTEGFSGAELEQAVLSGFFEAFAHRRPVYLYDFMAAIRATVPLSVTQSEQIAALREWAAVRAIPAIGAGKSAEKAAGLSS
ncbi:AAA family ATPase [Paenibacillus mesophilus]|uniref:AAA family ATPase n=1 Tax=Paenibacillus mesophilus TaxID=2582849 RepID=UPI00110E0192|nr:AAA family ATPase [Paenibacillus mesophilus]TMV51514.1 AAA family ATPase [Paenibacillus mesophilus]